MEQNKEKIDITKMLTKFGIVHYLIGLNILIFIVLHLTNLIIEPNWLINNFAKVPIAIGVDKEFYRLLTAVFIHQDLLHLVFNSAALLFLGRPIEYIFGKTRFLIIFLISGIFGTLFSFIFSPNYAIGASGGVFGIFGVHLYLFLKNKEIYLKLFGKDVLQLLAINVVIGFVLPSIDYWGHFGGILGGFLTATAFGLARKIDFKKSIIVGSVLTLIIFSSLLTIFTLGYDDYFNLVEDSIEPANIAINNDDTETLNTIIKELKEEQPFLPPTPWADHIINQIETYAQ
jgi:rhomboid protease GluP